MEKQKFVNFLNSSDNEFSKIATKNGALIDRKSKGSYLHHDPINFLTKSIESRLCGYSESSLCGYSDAYILVTGNTAVTRTIASASENSIQINQPLASATQLALKNCAPFKDCRTEIIDTFVDHADFINIGMPMYNLIEYRDHYSDTSGSLWGFERDEIVSNADVTNDNSAS